MQFIVACHEKSRFGRFDCSCKAMCFKKGEKMVVVVGCRHPHHHECHHVSVIVIIIITITTTTTHSHKHTQACECDKDDDDDDDDERMILDHMW